MARAGWGWMRGTAAVAVGPQLRGGLSRAPWRAAGAWCGFRPCTPCEFFDTVLSSSRTHHPPLLTLAGRCERAAWTLHAANPGACGL
eukprot:6113780-Prymnesium_polylepis.1